MSLVVAAKVALGPNIGGPVGMIGVAADVFWMYTNPQRRTIHDIVGGSVVVAYRPTAGRDAV